GDRSPAEFERRGKNQTRLTRWPLSRAENKKKTPKRLSLGWPPPVPCAPRVIFGDPATGDPSGGTFKRIQKQIFNQSCALSGCHDSQTNQNNMTLEAGSAYDAIANVTPYNQTAIGLGWKRIDAANANPDKSYLYHKITGDLPDELLGERMPRDRPKLDQFLIDIVKLWIEAGAPETGWVPGTD